MKRYAISRRAVRKAQLINTLFYITPWMVYLGATFGPRLQPPWEYLRFYLYLGLVIGFGTVLRWYREGISLFGVEIELDAEIVVRRHGGGTETIAFTSVSYMELVDEGLRLEAGGRGKALLIPTQVESFPELVGFIKSRVPVPVADRRAYKHGILCWVIVLTMVILHRVYDLEWATWLSVPFALILIHYFWPDAIAVLRGDVRWLNVRRTILWVSSFLLLLGLTIAFGLLVFRLVLGLVG